MTQRQAYAAARGALEDADNPMTHPSDVLNDILGYDRKLEPEDERFWLDWWVDNANREEVASHCISDWTVMASVEDLRGAILRTVIGGDGPMCKADWYADGRL